MTIQEWKNKGDYFKHKGHSIFHIIEGSGEPLLLLHGFPTSSFDWHLIWEKLTEKYQVICFDMIGYGYSAKPEEYDYSIFDQADIASALIGHLGLERIHILAHDKGDTVANELLARDNEQALKFEIATCCLLNGGLFPGIHKPRPVQWLLMTPIGKYLASFYTKGMLTKTFNRIFGPNTQPSVREMSDYWNLMERDGGKKVFHKLIYYMQDRIDNEKRFLEALQQTKVPLRLIDGMHDPISGAHMAKHYEKVIPNPDVVKLLGIGHYPQVEAPEQVLEQYFVYRTKNV